MDSTATKPSVLAKLLGFYTIEIRNLENGTTQARADLLVMENLFYDQKISKTFDLKGIQGRKVKASNTTSKTLFDGEWIEGTFYIVAALYMTNHGAFSRSAQDVNSCSPALEDTIPRSCEGRLRLPGEE